MYPHFDRGRVLTIIDLSRQSRDLNCPWSTSTHCLSCHVTLALFLLSDEEHIENISPRRYAMGLGDFFFFLFSFFFFFLGRGYAG